MKVTDEMVEAAAQFITKACFGCSWDGLRSGSNADDNGHGPISYSALGGMTIRGTKDGMRDLARSALTADLKAREAMK